MNFPYYIPFFLFIVAAWFFYQGKMKKQTRIFDERRERYIRENENLSAEQKMNLSNRLPWKGMDSQLLIELFGEPGRKRVLDQSMTRSIWSYADLFIYIDSDSVTEWKKR